MGRPRCRSPHWGRSSADRHGPASTFRWWRKGNTPIMIVLPSHTRKLTFHNPCSPLTRKGAQGGQEEWGEDPANAPVLGDGCGRHDHAGWSERRGAAQEPAGATQRGQNLCKFLFSFSAEPPTFMASIIWLEMLTRHLLIPLAVDFGLLFLPGVFVSMVTNQPHWKENVPVFFPSKLSGVFSAMSQPLAQKKVQFNLLWCMNTLSVCLFARQTDMAWSYAKSLYSTSKLKTSITSSAKITIFIH